MKQSLTILLVTLILFGCTGRTDRPPMTVTYVANCGFLIETGGTKIIIDGLLDGDQSVYYHLPSDSLSAAMSRGEPPFDSLDLIMFTHAHHDHFDADICAGNMLNNPQAVLVAPQQVEEELTKTDRYEQIKNRLHTMPPPDSVVELRLKGVDITILPSEHAAYWETDTLTGEQTDRHAATEHMDFILELAGWKIYHSGDAPLNDIERFRSLGFGDTTIDLAFVDWWDEREKLSFTQKLVKEVIRPQRAVMMHMFPNRPPRGEPQKYSTVVPEAYLADSLMQSWTFD